MSERHFRVCKLEGKNIELGGVSISSKASPGSAARKLLTSIAHHKGLKKNKKASMPKVKYCIQEYTQGSSKKIYGPYVGHYHKYTAAELKKAETADGKVKFTMKPVVKLDKGKNNMKVGGNETALNQFKLNKNLNLKNLNITNKKLIKDQKGILYLLDIKAPNGKHNECIVGMNEINTYQLLDINIYKKTGKKVVIQNKYDPFC